MALQQPQQHRQHRQKNQQYQQPHQQHSSTSSPYTLSAPQFAGNNNTNKTSSGGSYNPTVPGHHPFDILSSQTQTSTSSSPRSTSPPSGAVEKEPFLASAASTTAAGHSGLSSPGRGDDAATGQDGPSQDTSEPCVDSDETEKSSPTAGSGFTARCQDHLKLFFSMHHKLFDLVAFYVVMFAINGQMTSLPTRLEWIGFCVQSIVALRRAFQTSIKHGLGLTSFLGMLDLLVGQLFLHQDRLGLLPTVANILVYFYVINLTRGLVFGDSVSCLLWLLFGLVDIYRKDPSTASIIDLTPYRVIPVHTVGFGLYILMSELVDVMLHSAEPDPIQGRYLNYVGVQKEGPISIRSSSRRPSSSRAIEPSSSLRFELCITEITPYTVSFCLNALSDAPHQDHSVVGHDSIAKSLASSASTPSSASVMKGGTEGLATAVEAVDLSTIKIGPAVISNSSSLATRPSKATGTPKIISTSDIVIHVNYIPWHQVQYHFPDEQSFTLHGLTPSTDYEIEMKVHQFSSFVTRVGTRAAPAGTPAPSSGFGRISNPIDPVPKQIKNRKSRKNQKNQKDAATVIATTPVAVENVGETGKPRTTAAVVTSLAPYEPTTTTTNTGTLSTVAEEPQRAFPALDETGRGLGEQKTTNQVLLEQLQVSIEASVEAASTTKAALKKLKRDQSKVEASLRQELEGIGRGQAKALVQDQKRRQKLSFVQESIKQSDAHASALQEELAALRLSTLSSQPRLDETSQAIRGLEQRIQSTHAGSKAEMAPLKAESQHLHAEIKRLESIRANWALKAMQLRESEVAPLQLRLQRLEQQQVVWRVAAEASKDKDREVSVKIAALEVDIAKKTLQSQRLEETIHELKEKNVQLKESVEKEMEVWESLERESDADVDVDRDEGAGVGVNAEAEEEAQDFSFGSQQYAHVALGQQRYLDGSLEGPVRESHYWPVSGSGVSSGSDLWLASSSALSGQARSREYGPGSSESLWEAAERATRTE